MTEPLHMGFIPSKSGDCLFDSDAANTFPRPDPLHIALAETASGPALS